MLLIKYIIVSYLCIVFKNLFLIVLDIVILMIDFRFGFGIVMDKVINFFIC